MTKPLGFLLPFVVAWSLTTGIALAETKPMPENARVYIIWPADGQVIPGGKFWIRMGLSGAGIAPAGVEKQYTGHHHLLIDVGLPPLDQEIPNDKNHRHFGLGRPPYAAVAACRRCSCPAFATAVFEADHRHRPALMGQVCCGKTCGLCCLSMMSDTKGRVP
jgi:hypothetical protein